MIKWAGHVLIKMETMVEVVGQGVEWYSYGLL